MAQQLSTTNWDDLRIFLTVARHAKLETAATILHQDATTLGRRIRRLEAAIGATLFERSRKGHLLTTTGNWMLEQIEHMEHIVTDIDESIAGEVKRISGVVRLSATEAFGNLIIAPALYKLISKFPELKIELVSSSGFLSVSKREADMAILLSRPTRGRLVVNKLTDYQLKLYATKDYLNSHPKITQTSQLHDHVLIGYVDDLIYSPSLRYYDDIDTGLSPEITSSSVLAQTQLALSGCGIAMLPKFVGEKEQTLMLVLDSEVTVTRSFWLAVHEDIFEHARIKTVVSFMKQVVSDQAKLLRSASPFLINESN